MTLRRRRPYAILAMVIALLVLVPSSAFGAPVSNHTPATLQASRAYLVDPVYLGVVKLNTGKGSVRALAFGVSSFNFRNFRLSLPKSNGRAVAIDGRSLELRPKRAEHKSDVVLLRRLKGVLVGAGCRLLIDITPAIAPPKSWLTILRGKKLSFVKMTMEIYKLDRGNITIKKASVISDSDHRELRGRPVPPRGSCEMKSDSATAGTFRQSSAR